MMPFTLGVVVGVAIAASATVFEQLSVVRK